MKIDCGPTWFEKWKAKQAYLSNWHLIFVLWPRRIGPRQCVWLEHVWRKGVYESNYSGCYWIWEYKDRLP